MRAGWFLAIAVAAAACSAGSGPKLMGPLGDDGGPPDGAPPDGGPPDGGTDGPGNPGDLATACGGTAPVTFDDWENCYRKRKCEWEVGCVSLNVFRDVADCIASGDALEGGQLAAERRARKRAVDQARAAINVPAFTTCLLRTSAATCLTALHEPACLTRFTGKIADTQDCFTDIDCASPGAVCQTNCPDACCVGSCHRKLRLNEACSLSDSCEPGLVCNGSVCVTGDVGTSCDPLRSAIECDFGTFCDSKTRRCTPQFPPGAECTRLAQCGGDTTCVGLSISSSNPGHCLRISQPGDQCDDFCFGNLFCDTAAKICRKLPALDRTDPACSTLIPCAGTNTICNSGRCVLRSDVGVSCSGQTCLPGLFCTSELGDGNPKCAARRADNDACASPTHCQSFLCSGNASQPGVCLPWKNTCP
jgi:hypothetical protein